MPVRDIKPMEKEYFSRRKDRVLPELLCFYFDSGAYELTYYLSQKHLGQYGQAEFYFMMSLMQMEYGKEAQNVFRKNQGEWYNLCKQNDIYWKHVALFALCFLEFPISEYYLTVFDEYYDDSLVRLIELTKEAGPKAAMETTLFSRVSDKFPVLRIAWNMGHREKRGEVISFEDIQWNVWRKYNARIQNGDYLGIEQVYEKEGFRIYSYKPKEVSASMHILTDGISTIILDCGCEIVGTEVKRIPVREILDELGILHVDRVIISHAHMDHYGSLNQIRKQNVMMTSLTKQLIQYISPDVVLDCVWTVEPYKVYEVDGILVRFVPNGHICGSVMTDICWKDKLRIIYTGDYTVEDQNTVEGFHLKDILHKNSRKIDILLTETTYGDKIHMLRLEQYEKMFVQLCRKYLENGNKIVIPCFAVGRVQEVALILSQLAKEMGAKILIDGLAAGITEFYQLSMGKNILNRNISVCHSQVDYAEKISENDIILASSGMMKEGSTSAKYIEKIIERQNVCVMKVGFIHKEEHMLLSIRNRSDKNLNYVDIPLSAHAGYHDLVEITEKLSPDCAIYVHGSGIRV